MCVRILEWFRALSENFFSGLEKIKNKRLEQKQIYGQKQIFLKFFYVLLHCCTIDITYFIKENVMKKRPIFGGAKALYDQHTYK